jgi:hypothetical protein
MVAMLPALLAWGGGAREARAAGPAPIRIDLETCPAHWGPEIRLALAVELGDERLADAPPDQPPADPGNPLADGVGGHRLTVRCAEQRVWIVAHAANTGATLERNLTGDLPEATAPRVIALVAADLLTTFDPALRRRLEASAKPNRPASPPAPSLSSAPSPSPSPSPLDGRRLAVTAGAVYRSFLSSGGVSAWGGVMDARRASRDERWSAGLDVEIAGAERSTSIGQTSALLVSARASAGGRVRAAGDRLALSADLGVRGGAVRLSGRADDPNVLGATVVHPWAGPVATLRAELGLSWFCAAIAAEGGWAAVSASGIVNKGPALAASGPWLAISLAVGGRR